MNLLKLANANDTICQKPAKVTSSNILSLIYANLAEWVRSQHIPRLFMGGSLYCTRDILVLKSLITYYQIFFRIHRAEL